jgi:stage IV sporulation protein FB
MFWVVAIMWGLRLEQLPIILIWVIAFFVSILWHEMGHALVMRTFGLRPWITLYGMGGLASYDPAHHRRFRPLSAGEQILISFAGPGAGFLLTAALVGLLFAFGQGGTLSFEPPIYVPEVWGLSSDRLAMLLTFIFQACVYWGLVNLLPIYPLDGGQIARELFLVFSVREGIRRSLVLSIVTAISFGVFAAMQWGSWVTLLFFGFIAYENYQALQANSGRGKW